MIEHMFAFMRWVCYVGVMEITRLGERIRGVDVSSASVGELASLMGDLGRVKGWVGGVEAAAARRASDLEVAGEVPSAADMIARSTKTSRRSADRARRRGVALGHTPELSRQLERGAISTEHGDALATAAAKLDEGQRVSLFERDAELAVRAGAETPSQFARTLTRAVAEISLDDGIDRSEQQRRSATLSHGVDSDTGMGFIRADLHPDDYQKVKQRLDAEIDAMKHLPEYADHTSTSSPRSLSLRSSRAAVLRVGCQLMWSC